MPDETALPRLNLHGMLVSGIRELVAQGVLRPGEKISEPQLCARFDVSRTPLREALKVLAAEGLVELRPRRGAVVAPLRAEEIDEIFPIMAIQEALAGELLCKQASEADLQRLAGLHARLLAEFESQDEAAYLATNRAFHEALFDAAHNATLKGLYQQLLGRIRAFRFVVRKRPDHWRQAVEDHKEIITAILARDSRRLPGLLRRHVTGVTVAIARDAVEQTAAAARMPSGHPTLGALPAARRRKDTAAEA